MKKIIFGLILPVVMVNGLLFLNRKVKSETINNVAPKPLSAAESKSALKKWEASPDGIMFKKWEASSSGQKVHAGAAKIKNYVRNNSNMEGVITSLSLPPGSRLGFGVMLRINEEEYILSFGADVNNEFKQLQSLKVNDKIITRSHFVSKAPKYSYPIVAGDYVERASKVLYKRVQRKGGC